MDMSVVQPEWILMAFLFALGACVGSFLNVVVYRVPLGKSIATPPSSCPACGTQIRPYDNIPLLSWLILRGKCRTCKTPISVRYFIGELITACLFLGVYLWYFYFHFRALGFEEESATQQFLAGGWLFYLNAIVLLAAFLAASAIDLEHWIIPIEICWLVTVVGILAATLAGYVIDPSQIEVCALFPVAYTKGAAIAFGATAGLLVSLTGLWCGLIKPSYPMEEGECLPESTETQTEESVSTSPLEISSQPICSQPMENNISCQVEEQNSSPSICSSQTEGDTAEIPQQTSTEPAYNDRVEILKEIVFLLPVVVGAAAGLFLCRVDSVSEVFKDIMQIPAVKGFAGSLLGYFVGCATVWATRIFGTLAFGREAMGLGDVHLMGAAGAVIGPWMVVLAFFAAPFFGIFWALYQWICKKSRQIPYGPFLSTAVFGVMIFYDWIRNVFLNLYGF